MTPSVHISLHVQDLGRSVDFYRRFLGEPAKLKEDYAKFVSRDPEIHLALEPGLVPVPGAGRLSHLGIRVATPEEVERRKQDLAGRGVEVEELPRAECCYALQDKFWLTDPDGNRWEIYTVIEDVERREPLACATCCPQ
ncbi:MAG TPA: ArsI/CadI family heavy metal resistance metalloenzyme [Candidatus Polarisedimenticolia bacterium]|jgi:catechol 2,3-dioxygenase-like lactoylglutathione lyase family enzyme|nr:ArsI/CadI family heavy metal resistance metalloenzyme [Candidatus Polarisedimenticolia bacterium]